MSSERSPAHDDDDDGGQMPDIKFKRNKNNSIMIPLESNHFILQQQLEQNLRYNNNSYNNNNNLKSNIKYRTTNSNNIIPSPFTTSASTTTSSKLLVLQSSFNENYLNGNDSDKVMILPAEQITMDNTESLNNSNNNSNNILNGQVISSTNDEELTPLTWLHDKNLLKGINLSGNNSKIQLNDRQIVSISPTSDFVEDSNVSEDNTSLHSSSEHNLNVYGTEPQKTTFHLANINNNNNNTINKNRNTITSKTILSPGGTSGAIIGYLYNDSHINEEQLQEEEVQEQQIKKSLLSPTINHTPQTTYANNIPTLSTTTTSPVPHQHYHKKYLREHDKSLKQNNNSEFVTPAKQTLVTNSSSSSSNSNSKFETEEYVENNKSAYINTPTKNAYNVNSSSSSDDSVYTTKALSSPSTTSSNNKYSQKQKHPTNVPYNPLIHTSSKPPYSFSSLIFMAIEDCTQKALPVKEIYAWIVQHFPYFKTAPTGWKNSVRHNLSLNKCFQKVEKAANLGKGSLWMVEQQYRPNLIQALTRSPFHSCSTLDRPSSYKTTSRSSESPPPSAKNTSRLPNPEHFPFLARRLAAMESNCDDLELLPHSRSSTPNNNYDNQTRYINNPNANERIIINQNFNGEISVSEWGTDSIEDVNAATAMLALKHGPKIFSENFQNDHSPVITSSPSEDHTYSAGGSNRSNSNSDNNSNGTSSDAAYESSDESHNRSRVEDDIEEQKQRQTVVDALLNLAGLNSIIIPAKSSSPTQFLKRQSSDTYIQQPQQQSQQSSESLYAYYNPQDSYLQQFNGSLSPSPPKKSKSRILRTKLKKRSWLR